MELGRLQLALADAQRAFKGEWKAKEIAEGLAASLAMDVYVLQKDKLVLEKQVQGEVLVDFLLDVCSRFSNTF